MNLAALWSLENEEREKNNWSKVSFQAPVWPVSGSHIDFYFFLCRNRVTIKKLSGLNVVCEVVSHTV